MSDLFQKYNVPAPRYTSYPTVPFWDSNNFEPQGYFDSVKNLSSEDDIAIYIHLPFCESLCTFCGCNKRITKNHSVEEPYIDSLLKEWELYRSKWNFEPLISEIHFGGGTPTFFKPDNLKRLVEGIMKGSRRSEKWEWGFEAHPNSTSKEHIETLSSIGFNRLSLGIQDVNHEIQVAINRIQPWQGVVDAVSQARDSAYKSINFDLVYGLPFQKWKDVKATIEATSQLRPGRLAFYSYAHVPWIKGLGQRKFTEADLPAPEEKRELYERGREMLEKEGYVEIGMDHFALKSDSLYDSMLNKKLHRNFMGYTTQRTGMMIGLGVSSISETPLAFAQNEKTLEAYQQRVNSGHIPVFRGHLHNEEDLFYREKVLELMCFFETEIPDDKTDSTNIVQRLKPLIDDGLVRLDGSLVSITEKGKPFLRNACMAFDMRLWRARPEEQMFSMSI